MTEDKLDRIIDLLVVQNGQVAELMTDYYGDTDRNIEGTKPQVDAVVEDVARVKTVVKAFGWLLSLPATAGLVALFRSF